MTEQQPTREQIAEALYQANGSRWLNDASGVPNTMDLADAVLALFSQPTPSTEHGDDWKCERCGGSSFEHSRPESTCIWEPVPIAEMAPEGGTVDDAYDHGRADGWSAAVEVAKAVADDEGTIDYEETNRAAGAAAVLAALERGGEPVSIADMAPGTTFTATMLPITHRLRVPSTPRLWLRDCGDEFLSIDPAYVDPSTIRDVTPPPTITG